MVLMNLQSTYIQRLRTFIVLLVASLNAFSSIAAELSTKEIDFFNQQLNRPAKVKFWYQSSENSCHAKMCLTPQQTPNRIAIISHGAFGSPREMNWLGYALASQGWVVAGVAHFGESWVYGTESIDPSTASRFWQRPQDVSFVIDSLSNDGLFNRSLALDKLIMVGHSSGGFTSLALAGATLESGKSEAYCRSDKANNDKGCQYSKKGRSKPLTQDMMRKIGLLQRQMQDPRIGGVIALDPALGHAVNEQSLAQIDVPTLVIGSVNNDFLPYITHAKYYADHIQRATLVGIEQGAGHFIYIDSCNADRKANGVPLCKDRDGVNRDVIQKQILVHIFGFIYKNGLG
ncbi:alpha/beta hydrolase family protein [Thalassotalea euphylliae]|uniref:alpha/beta hydrolase family protein n=1 Tax=Thalassotalea euphylliae TaxID=1655234 RepID=UPI00362D28CC